MNYVYQQTISSQRMTGIAFVIALHIVLIWALVSGLARDVVKVIQHKVEVKLLEEPPPPPPPPPPKKIVQKVLPNVPPPIQEYVPPVEAPPPRVDAPSAITAVKTDAIPAPPSVPKTKGSIKASGVCAVMPTPEYPAAALQEEITGQVTVRFKVTALGRLSGIVSTSFVDIPNNYRNAFAREISKALSSYQCNQDLEEAILEKVFVFKLE